MLKIEDLHLVKMTDTAKIAIKYLSQRERISRDTTIDPFLSYLRKKGENINSVELHRFFKELEECGAGELKQDPEGDAFVWYYSLKDIADQLLNPTTQRIIKSIDTTLGRVKKVSSEPAPHPYNVVFLFKLDNGSTVPLSLTEADRLAAEVKLIRSRLSGKI